MTDTITPSRFAVRSQAFLDELFRLDPLRATAAGMHAYDAAWPDVTEAGRRQRLLFADRWAAELVGFAAADLTPDERADRDLLLMELDAIKFNDTELRKETWDPLEWVYLLGGGIFLLLAREFAPLADRLASVVGRLETLPAVIDGARAQLVGTPGRPVSRFHTQTALAQLQGVRDLVDDAVNEAQVAAPANPGVAALLPRLREAAATARTALDAFEAHLRDLVLPASDGEGRLGADLFTTKMRHTLQDAELTPTRILERAEREYAAVRAEMIRIARGLWPAWCPAESLPTAASDGSQDAADQRTVRAVLDSIAGEHPPASDLLDFCRAALTRIEDFCRERDLVGLTEEPLEIRWTPVFLRALAGAMLDSPGPLDHGQKSFFAITPIHDDWSSERAESYLREDNDRMLRVLTIHEAVPGHYLQLAYANRCGSVIRSVFGSGVLAEGWAVYVTQVMVDSGYGAEDPALLLVHWKFYLRAVTNAIIDVRIHAGEAFGGPMTRDEAVRFMVEGGFQEQAEADNKYDRARLSSTQLSTYFVGSMAMWELEGDVRRRLAAHSGDPRGAGAVQQRALPGGFGETPGFVYRRHLEAVLGHGSLPTSLLRRLVLGA
jgi:uncharacterized protein (DUF885 family)